MYDTNGKLMASQVTSRRDYSAQTPHHDIITQVPSPLTWPDDQVMWVCVDCYFAYHNGDFSETADALPFSEFNLSDGAIPIHQYVTDGMSTFWCDCPTDNNDVNWEEHKECETRNFSSSPCGACSTFLAGTRYAMTYDARYTR